MMPDLARAMHRSEMRTIRAALGLSLEEMSAELLVSRRQYIRYESGATPIPRLRAKEARAILEAKRER
jgi:transcriptional regulator with XRE-family HTH domain